jgi:Fe-S cluster biogenesis protein NfuA
MFDAKVELFDACDCCSMATYGASDSSEKVLLEISRLLRIDPKS